VASVLQDARFAFRALCREPLFAGVAVLCLALGIGASTAIFSLVNGVLIRALPYADANRLVSLREYSLERGAPSPGDPNGMVAYPNFLDLQSQVDAFSDMAASTTSRYLMLGAGGPEQLWGAPVTTNYFALLGVPAAIGRTLVAGETDAVVVLSDGLWRRSFGAAPDVVGRSIRLNDEPFEVVGVMPPGFRLPYHTEELWLPVESAPRDFIINGITLRNRESVRAIGRLAPDATLERADAQSQLVVERLRREYPDTTAATGVQLVPLHETRVGRIRPTLLMLFGAVGLLTLIACVNVANLLLARATMRGREAAVRAALGAGRWRITRLFLTESTMLSLAGGAVGMLLAHGSVRVIRAMSAGDIPRIDEVGIDLNVLAFTFAVSLAAGLLAGLAPALRATRSDLDAALRGGGGFGGRAASGRRMRDALVVAEVALALILLIGAGLLVNSFRYLWTFDPGFEPRGVLTAQISLERSRYPDPPQRDAFFASLFERLRGLSPVEAVGSVGRLPGRRIGIIMLQIKREDSGTGADEEPLHVMFSPVRGDYFEAMRIPLLAGRPFREGDPATVVINEALARELWPESPAVGRRISVVYGGETQQTLEIVGVVENQRFLGLDPVPQPELFVPPEAGLGGGSPVVVVRTRGDPLELAGAVREAVGAIDPEQPIASIVTMEQALADSLAQPRFYMAMFSLFGALALALSAAGIFGVASYSVTQRVHELGVRIALGAGRGDLLKLVVGRGAVLIGIGIVIGSGAARALTRYLESLVYGIAPTDPATFVSVSLGMAAVALIAFWLPGRRAASIDPIVALRRD
jgi:putative ABC transport system permease protein